MTTKSSMRAVGLGAVISAVVAFNASAIIALGTTGTGNMTAGPYTVGDVFTVSQSIDVTSLGAFRASASSGVTVAIYQLTGFNSATGQFSTETLIPGLETTFSGSASSTIGNTVFNNVNALLASGTYMIVANAYGTAAGSKADGYNLKNSGTAPTGAGSSSTVTFYDAGYHRANGTLASSYTYSSWTGANAGVNIGLTAPQWVAGNFQYTLTPVPEVETFALAGVGMLGLVFIGRKVVTRRTV